jgi:hypothetical protein
MGGHRGLPLVGTESIKNLAGKELLLSPQAHSNFTIILYWKRNLISGSLFDWKMLVAADFHADNLGNTGPAHVADGNSSKIMKLQLRHPGSLAGFLPGSAEILDALARAIEYPWRRRPPGIPFLFVLEEEVAHVPFQDRNRA